MKEPQDIIQILEDLPQPFFTYIERLDARVVKVGIFQHTPQECAQIGRSTGIIDWWLFDGPNGWRHVRQSCSMDAPLLNQHDALGESNFAKAILGSTENSEPIVDLNVINSDTKMLLLDSANGTISQHTKADIGRIVRSARADSAQAKIDPRTATVQHSKATWGR